MTVRIRRGGAGWRWIPVLFASALLAACAGAPVLLPDSGASQSGDPTKHTGFEQFPDIPIPMGAKLNADKTLVFGSKPWFGQLALDTGTNADKLFDFYRQHLPQYQWQEITSVRAPTSILTYSREDRVLAIAIRGATLRGSEITITVSPRGGDGGMPPAGGTSGGIIPPPVQKAP